MLRLQRGNDKLGDWDRLRKAACGASLVGAQSTLGTLTFSWFGRNRRLTKDYKNLGDTLATFVTLAAVQLAIRRLARTEAFE